MLMVLRASASPVLTLTRPGREPSGDALVVVGAGGLLLAERLDRHHLDLGLGQAAEELRQLGVHLVDVLLVERRGSAARDLARSSGFFSTAALKALEIVVAELLGDLQHLALDPRHLLQADLVDLLRASCRSSSTALTAVA